MGFNEGRFLAGIDKRRQTEKRNQEQQIRGPDIPPVVAKLHERLKRDVFTNPEYTVQSPEFFSVYGEEAVKNDMREVLRLRAEFQKQKTPQIEKAQKLSETFEGLILLNAKHNRWFGDATLFKTSSYDDIKNKTDMYGEWKDEHNASRVLALAVDLTFSQQKGADKLAYIKRSIERGELGRIKYFKDPRGGFMGTKTNVPRVVLGVGTRELADLATLWIQRKHDALEHHPVRDMLIHEMHTQLTGMQKYAEKLGEHEVAKAYADALEVVAPLQHETEHVRQSSDPVFRTIEERMKDFR